MRSKPTELTDAIHIVHGLSAGGTARDAFNRVNRCIILRDHLVLGPSHVDPQQHRELRISYWRRLYGRGERIFRTSDMEFDIESVGELGHILARFPADRAIVIWSTPTLSDRLSLWWTLDAVARLELECKRIWLAEPRRERSEADLGHLEGLGSYPSKDFRRGFPDAQPLSAGMLKAGAALWRSFTGQSPVRFEQSLRKKEQYFPEADTLLSHFACLFPRLARANSKQLRLSFLDQFILDGLSTSKWKTPYDIIRQDKTGRFFFLLAFLGDLCFAHRMMDWAEHAPDDPFVVGRAEEAGCSPFTNNNSYQLTERGQVLRETAMANVLQAPPIHAGGFTIGDPRRPWVTFEKGPVRIGRIARNAAS